MAVATDSAQSSKADPKSVQVNVTAGTGMDIAWKDGHQSHFSFQWLRDACPCALCDEERSGSGRAIGAAVQPKPGELPIFKGAVKATEVTPVGKYAISFKWSDGHQHGIYSWDFLRKECPCEACAKTRGPVAG